MVYPITLSQQRVKAGETMSLPFRPTVAGLVNVVLNAQVVIPQPAPTSHSGENDPPSIPVLALQLDVFAPGDTTPVFTKSYGVKVEGTVPDNVLLFGDIPASANQLTADWTVKVTNTSTSKNDEIFDVTVRYQATDGNLGKVDHIVVVMMENRSFDHMLGYLKAVNGDVDGLTTKEFNHDVAGNNYPVKKLLTTNFITDPGHGWTDVAGTPPGQPKITTPYQLSGDSGAGLATNAGFVQNFAQQIAASSPQPPHDIITLAPNATHTIQFLPEELTAPTGKIGARSVPISVPAKSSSGLLGTLSLFRPDGGNPVATGTAAIGSGAVSVTGTIALADMAILGNWLCQLTNNSDETLDFITDISKSTGPLTTSNEEPLASIMGYYDNSGVPLYDMLASQFVICDRWFASIPTDTFPNRLYAMSGGSGGLLTTPSDASVASNPPAYTMKTIFEVLQENGVDWNVFFSDLPFALVFTALAQDAQYTSRMLPFGTFLQKAPTGDLPSVAWIDPNYNDVPDGTDNANDDHPPGDVARGQQFIAQVVDALAASPCWSKSLLIITYDEHGGFFDHVQPPGTPPRIDGPKDDDPNLTRYGVRVPAIVVSPWVAKGQVSHTIYDHTSILRTILDRFCAQKPVVVDTKIGQGGVGLPSTIPSMGARTDNANDLGPLLSLDVPRLATPISPAVASLASKPGTQSPLTGIGATLRMGLLGF